MAYIAIKSWPIINKESITFNLGSHQRMRKYAETMELKASEEIQKHIDVHTQIVVTLVKMECSLTDLRTGKTETKEIILKDREDGRTELLLAEQLEHLGYKVNSIHLAEEVFKQWTPEELWDQITKTDSDKDCLICGWNLKCYCDRCKDKSLFEPRQEANHGR